MRWSMPKVPWRRLVLWSAAILILGIVGFSYDPPMMIVIMFAAVIVLAAVACIKDLVRDIIDD